LVEDGTLHLSSGSSTGGSFQVDATATIDFNNFGIIDQNSSVWGEGTATFGGATINCPYSVDTTIIQQGTAIFNNDSETNTCIISGGTLKGTGNFTVNGTCTWTGGTMSGSGTTIIPDSAQLIITGSAFLSLELTTGRTLQNDGSIEWTGARVAISSDGTATIDNNGSLTVNVSGTAEIDAIFNNYGSLNLQQGTLKLGGGGYLDGASTVSIPQSTTLDFSGGNFEIDDVLNCPGNVDITGAAVTFSDGATIYNGVFSAGAIAGNGTLNTNGNFIWTGGTMQNTGGTDNYGRLVLDDDGNAPPSLLMGLGSSVNNYGTIAAEGTGGVALSPSESQRQCRPAPRRARPHPCTGHQQLRPVFVERQYYFGSDLQ
jgi:hypothetical protein